MGYQIAFYAVSVLLAGICIAFIGSSKLLLQSFIDYQNKPGRPIFIADRPNYKRFRAEVRMSDHLFSRSELPEGYAERDLARKIVQDLPLDDLKKLFNIESISPNEKCDPWTPQWRFEKIQELRYRREHEYRAEVRIFE